MLREKDRIVMIKEITEDIIRLTVQDHNGRQVNEREKAVELLARALYDFSILYLSQPLSHNEESLKGILAKVQIASNIMEQATIPNPTVSNI